jgi:hypothetical protein
MRKFERMPPAAVKLMAAPEVGEVALVQAAFAHLFLGLSHSNKARELDLQFPSGEGSDAEGWTWWDAAISASSGEGGEVAGVEGEGSSSSSGVPGRLAAGLDSSTPMSKKESENMRFRSLALPSKQERSPESSEQVSGGALHVVALGPKLQEQLDLVFSLAMQTGFIVALSPLSTPPDFLTGEDRTCDTGLQCSPVVLLQHLRVLDIQQQKLQSEAGREGKGARDAPRTNARDVLKDASSGSGDSRLKGKGGKSGTLAASLAGTPGSSSSTSSTSSSSSSSSSKVVVTPELVQLMVEVAVLSGAAAEAQTNLEIQRHHSKASADVVLLLGLLLTRLDVDQTREVVRRIGALLLQLILAHVKANSWDVAKDSRTRLLLETLPGTIYTVATANGKAPGEQEGQSYLAALHQYGSANSLILVLLAVGTGYKSGNVFTKKKKYSSLFGRKKKKSSLFGRKKKNSSLFGRKKKNFKLV